MTDYTNSFYPAAKKVFFNPVVRWILGIVGGLIITSWTVGVWPFFKGWVTTRADVETVEELQKRVANLESRHKSELSVREAELDDAGSLVHGKQVEWLIIHTKRLELREVELSKHVACLEARIKMPKPHADAAKAICKEAERQYNECLKDPTNTATSAINCALKSVFGGD
jgi:hypothetical protein